MLGGAPYIGGGIPGGNLGMLDGTPNIGGIPGGIPGGNLGIPDGKLGISPPFIGGKLRPDGCIEACEGPPKPLIGPANPGGIDWGKRFVPIDTPRPAGLERPGPVELKIGACLFRFSLKNCKIEN